MLSQNVLDAKKHPESHFKSTSITPVEKNKWQIKGNFSFHGVTREIKFKAQFERKEKQIKLKTMIELDMEDYKIDPPSVAGVVNVDEDFQLNLTLLFTQS